MPRFIGPGCMTIAWSGSCGHPGAVEAVAAGVLAGAGEERGVHPLALHPQHHHHVALGEHGVEVVRRRARPGVDADRQQRRRRDQGDLGAEGVQQQHVGAGDPAVQHVADDRDPAAVEVARAVAQVPAHRERVEQRLGGVLVGAVAGVDDRAADPAGVGQPVRRAGGGVADHDGVGAHRLEGQRGVLEALALGDARALGREVDDVGRQPLGGGLEGDPGAGGVLEEEVDHGAAAQGRQLLDRRGRPGGASSSAVSRTSSGVVAGRGRRRRAGGLHRATPVVPVPLVRSLSVVSMVTLSSPSVSSSSTWTRSAVEVGRFLPT